MSENNKSIILVNLIRSYLVGKNLYWFLAAVDEDLKLLVERDPLAELTVYINYLDAYLVQAPACMERAKEIMNECLDVDVESVSDFETEELLNGWQSNNENIIELRKIVCK